jgi:glycine/D-amino acid oxidase-like deaminating enzyme
MTKLIKKDVIVVGGGIGGLYVTYKLASLGIKVLLVEDKDVLCSGPSSRNGSKLHRGTFHSALIDNEERALQTALRCIYGYDQIKSFAPECIDVEALPNFAIIRSDSFAERAIRRWNAIDVIYKPISYETLSEYIPGLERSYARHIFQVVDAPINYRMLFQKLLHSSEKNGAEVMLCTNLTLEGKDSSRAKLSIRGEQETIDVEASYYVFTTGYGTKQLIETYFPDGLKVRLWKNHALILPRFMKNGFFSIEAGEPSLMPRGNYSIVCQSQEDTIMDTPNFEVNLDTSREVFNALLNVFPIVKQYETTYQPTACMKPDIVYSSDPSRTVNVEIHRLSPYHILTLPGKASEVPYLADQLVRTIFEPLSDKRISLRPGDTMSFDAL